MALPIDKQMLAAATTRICSPHSGYTPGGSMQQNKEHLPKPTITSPYAIRPKPSLSWHLHLVRGCHDQLSLPTRLAKDCAWYETKPMRYHASTSRGPIYYYELISSKLASFHGCLLVNPQGSEVPKYGVSMASELVGVHTAIWVLGPLGNGVPG